MSLTANAAGIPGGLVRLAMPIASTRIAPRLSPFLLWHGASHTQERARWCLLGSARVRAWEGMGLLSRIWEVRMPVRVHVAICMHLRPACTCIAGGDGEKKRRQNSRRLSGCCRG